MDAANQTTPERSNNGIAAEKSDNDLMNHAQIEQAFHDLAEQWRRETAMCSSIAKKVEHAAYRKIIAMGEQVLPLILRELRDRPGYWFEALKAISRQSPVGANERADPKKVREAWLQWGKGLPGHKPAYGKVVQILKRPTATSS
jgi:hypothetical protein